MGTEAARREGTVVTKIDGALQLLANLAERFPNAVESFLNSLNSPNELVQVQIMHSRAGSALQTTFDLEPSVRLLEFLAANSAGESEDVTVGK